MYLYLLYLRVNSNYLLLFKILTPTNAEQVLQIAHFNEHNKEISTYTTQGIDPLCYFLLLFFVVNFCCLKGKETLNVE